MEIILTNEKSTRIDLNVSADFEETACGELISVAKDGINRNANLKIGVKRWTDGEHGEEEILRRACRKVMEYAVGNGYSEIFFDVRTFSDNLTEISCICNIITEELSEIAENDGVSNTNVTIFLNTDKDYEDYISELNYELDKPVLKTVNHAYGDYGDTLKEEFEKFQKKLSRNKTFREYLVDIMNQRGVRKSSEVYKPAGVSKSTFSKIINFSFNPPYKPSKETVAALAIGLKLDLKSAQEFYGYAGFYLGENEFIDKVIRFFIGKKIYRIYDVNYCLIDHGYPPLGEKSRGEKFEIKIK